MTYPKIEGLCGISAQVIAYSMSPEGIRLITMEVTYPRLVLAELNTHRMLSKNSASSRAIPFNKMLENLTGRPVRFGEANPGMQDKGQDFDTNVEWDHPAYTVAPDFVAGSLGKTSTGPAQMWTIAKQFAVSFSKAFYKAGFHKQVYNRLTEPFQMMKTVISGTEWNNFFWLRDHDAADPTLRELARVMWEAIPCGSEALILEPGEWHLPYIEAVRNTAGTLNYFIEADEPGMWTLLEERPAIEVSSARCAAVSFRNTDYGVDKSQEVFARLVGEDRKHASSFEHQATPMEPTHFAGRLGDDAINTGEPETWQEGVSHMTRDGQLWSGNLKGWIQHRKLISGECKAG